MLATPVSDRRLRPTRLCGVGPGPASARPGQPRPRRRGAACEGKHLRGVASRGQLSRAWPRPLSLKCRQARPSSLLKTRFIWKLLCQARCQRHTVEPRLCDYVISSRQSHATCNKQTKLEFRNLEIKGRNFSTSLFRAVNHTSLHEIR